MQQCSKAGKDETNQPPAQSESRHLLDQIVHSLSKLLTSQPAAEELADTWYGTVSKGDSKTASEDDTKKTKSSTGKDASASSSSSSQVVNLRSLKRGLDTEKPLSSSATPGDPTSRLKGLPLWIVVRTLKASWHADGTWPLLASDEPLPSAAVELASSSSSNPTEEEVKDLIPLSDGIPRSIHPSSKLLRPPNATCFQLPLTDLPPLPVGKGDPSMDQIAQKYRERGIDVGEPPVGNESNEDW